MLEDLIEKNCSFNSFQSLCPSTIDNFLTYFKLSLSKKELTFSQVSSFNTKMSLFYSVSYQSKIPPSCPQLLLALYRSDIPCFVLTVRQKTGNIKTIP